MKVIYSAEDRVADDEVDAAVEPPEVVVSPAPCFKDFLIMCATQPGLVFFFFFLNKYKHPFSLIRFILLIATLALYGLA